MAYTVGTVKEKKEKAMKNIIVVATLLAAYGLVGAMDYRDEQREQAHYCGMVESGHWPDYRGEDTCTQ